MTPLRLAYVSPLPPEQTGIADYSAELLPALAAELARSGGQVVGYTSDPQAAPRELAAAVVLRPYRELAARAPGAAGAEHDVVLYHVGNNPDFHAEIYHLLGKIPGAVVLHEPMLHHLVRGLTLSRHDAAGYVAALRRCHGTLGEAVGRAFVDHQRPFDIWSYPLFEEAVDRSLGLIVHNDFTRRRVRASRPTVPVTVVPHHLSLRELAADPAEREVGRVALRRRLGLADDAFVIGSFGFITPAKRLEVVLPAFARLRADHPQAVLLLAGDVSAHYDLQSLLARVGLPAGALVHHGHLALPDFLLAMELVDVAVNLRHPTGGETSGTLMRLLGLGKPVVVTDAGAFRELPSNAAAKVALNVAEEESLLAVLQALVDDPVLRRAMGAAAAQHMSEHHTLVGSVRGYLDFVRELAHAEREGRGWNAKLATPDRVSTVTSSPSDVRAALLAAVAAEVVDLGVDERDLDLWQGLARTATELVG